jgi:hypothetical protein
MKLVIANTDIHQDTEGRYSLNDLHRAAGAEDKHNPDRFLRLDTTQALIAEISNSPEMENKNPMLSKAGRYGGSHACREIVYAYAMWISPAFHLKVIRAYDEIVTAKIAALDGPAHSRLTPIAADWKAAKNLAKWRGMNENHATLAADKATLTRYSLDVAKLLGAPTLVADSRGLTYPPGQTLKLIPTYAHLTDQKAGMLANQMLLNLGYQQRDEHGKWEPTEKGQPFGEWGDVNTGHGLGSPKKQWRWFKEVAAILANVPEEVAA